MRKRNRLSLKASELGKKLIKDARNNEIKKATRERIEAKEPIEKDEYIDEIFLRKASEILERDKNWDKVESLQQYALSPAMWKRFKDGKEYINAQKFIVCCQVLGLNWEDVAENEVDAKRNLREAPNVANFFGRIQQLTELQQWLIKERCRLVVVYGMAGIGKSALVRNLVDKIADKYDYIIWLSLESAPPFTQILIRLVQFLSKGEKEEGNISELMQYLKAQRCLIVLDGWQEIIGDRSEDYTNYKVFGEKIAKEAHKSSLLLLSREKPQNIALLEGKLVRCQRLGALTYEEAKQILIAEGLSGQDSELEEFSRRYSNPWILEKIAPDVRTVFAGDISPFMANSILVNDEITNFLDRQFEKLKKAEINLIYWVAIRRNLASWHQLVQDHEQFLSYNQLFQTLKDLLERRSLLTINSEDIPIRYILEPVILKYTTNKFVESSFQEINQVVVNQDIQGSELFITHNFITEQPEDEELNQQQMRRIVQPIKKMLLAEWLSQQQLEDKLRNVLSLLEDKKLSFGYGHRNISHLISAG
ncbi:WD-repeat protein [Calothrix sp. NIES-2100]|uniref:NB-ARC domain-containing protein n=1 Tax=Calothrix sp. NIES-2100 TaxID=1954172 RepID=UPI000B5F61A2|nr:WD-repeat protein [Calothrix sp. NIES-2100]